MPKNLKDYLIYLALILVIVTMLSFLVVLLKGSPLLLGGILGIGALILVGGAIINRMRLKSLIVKKEPFMVYKCDIFLYKTEMGQYFPGVYDPRRKTLIYFPETKMEMMAGTQHFFLNWIDTETEKEYNLMWNILEKSESLSISGKLLPEEKTEAIQKIHLLARMIESGKIPQANLTPALIEKVIEKETTSKEESKEAE